VSKLVFLVGQLPVWLLLAILPAHSAEPAAIEEVVVRASLVQRLGETGSWQALGAEEIAAIGATHVSETLARIPGVWISRGSGQEHLTAIRSAVFTGAGACGEFLYLEDGVPTRPAGFCNINDLFELNTEQAGGVEVWRGPASTVLGGNALHGAINVLTNVPEHNSISVEAGPYDFYRVGTQFKISGADQELAVNAHSSSTNGYRDDTGYDQQKVTIVHLADAAGWQMRNTFSATLLNQETGGYVEGFEAYKDDQLRRTNPNPEAFRDAWSVRAASHLTRGPWELVPYIRRSGMRFLQHFLPGEPLEENHQTSGGLLADYRQTTDALSFELGAQVELLSGSLVEDQRAPLTTSSSFNNAVRPQGLHYDYDVDSLLLAGHYDVRWRLAPDTALIHNLRVEYLDYDYSNNMLTGNTREDGTTCGFGGCLYNRPASRDDNFTEVAGRLGVEHDFANLRGYVVVGSGFRPPQTTELYRLQRGQDVADLQSERLISAEAGVKGQQWSVAAFAERTRHFIFRDAAGFNVSDGRTRSIGVEFAGFVTLDRHLFEIAGTYAEHRYDFDRAASAGELIEDGNYMDTAPRWLGNARWEFRPTAALASELELNYQGKHYINADNTARYGGHVVLNWRGSYQLHPRVQLFARVINVLDKKYADRADYTTFGSLNYRYFPAMPRQLYVGVNCSL